jgi:SAM-dependent methyltransferase
MARDAECIVKRHVVCLLVCWSMLLPVTARAQAQALDVPYVPTPAKVVDAMLRMANVRADDYVVDLGCGDGRLVIAAAKRYGAHGFGVDLDPKLVNEAQHEALRQGVQDQVAFYERNLYITDFSQASVLMLYLFPKVNLDLRPRLFHEVRPGTRVVSHDFDFGAWAPDASEIIAVPGKTYGAPQSTIYFWIVPGDASGRWKWQLNAKNGVQDYDVSLEQTFQVLRAREGGAVRTGSGRMRGDEVRFTLTMDAGGHATRQDYAGRIAGDTIVGTVRIEGEPRDLAWQATRIAHGKINIEGSADPH